MRRQHFFNINILSTSTICQHSIDINNLSPSTLYRHQQIIDTLIDLFGHRQVFDKTETKRRHHHIYCQIHTYKKSCYFVACEENNKSSYTGWR